MTTTPDEPWPDWFTPRTDAETPIYRSVAADHGDPQVIPTEHDQRHFVHPDGSRYERIDPHEFDDFDTVDSRTITDDGEPDAD